jgi:DNA invertase Pin-like site-specific DNA recombinase
MCYVRAYLRASTDKQDATRARDQLKAFAAERGLEIVSWYLENESGAKLARPELFKLLADAHEGNILLVEQVDRLSRLTAADWERLKAELNARRVRVVALDLPSSWIMAAKATDEFTTRMFGAINGMLLDMVVELYTGCYRLQPRHRRQDRQTLEGGSVSRRRAATSTAMREALGPHDQGGSHGSPESRA